MRHEARQVPSWLIFDVRQRKIVNTALREFEANASEEGFTVAHSRKVARIVEYQDSVGLLEFAIDLGSKGNHSVELDAPFDPEELSRGTPEARRLQVAFDRTKRFLEACGFEVELSQ